MTFKRQWTSLPCYDMTFLPYPKRSVMIIFYDVMERMRTTLATQTQNPKIKDRDIAIALGLTPQYFAVIKRRNKIPYEALAHFCRQHHISLNWLLMAQEPRYLT